MVDRIQITGGFGRYLDIDDVTDAVLILDEHEDPAQEVLDETLRTESQCHSHDPGAGDQRPEVHARLTERREQGDRPDDDRRGAADHERDRMQPGLPSGVVLGDADRLRLRELANRSTLAVEELDALRDRMASVQDHHDMQAAIRQGRNGYALSVVAAIFLPLGFLTGLFGVNVGGIPLAEDPWGFFEISLILGVITLLQILLFRWRRWF